MIYKTRQDRAVKRFKVEPSDGKKRLVCQTVVIHAAAGVCLLRPAASSQTHLGVGATGVFTVDLNSQKPC